MTIDGSPANDAQGQPSRRRSDDAWCFLALADWPQWLTDALLLEDAAIHYGDRPFILIGGDRCEWGGWIVRNRAGGLFTCATANAANEIAAA